MSRIITVTSGKGGVGKTSISVNLALYLAEEGYRTCLFDADMGLANVDILLGLHPELTLEDVILEKKGINEIIVKDFMGLDIIPGSSGLQRLADPKPEELSSLIAALSGLENYDFLIVDTSAGIAKNVISFCMASSEIILVVTPEPTSLTDAYSLLKVLSLNGFSGSVMVAVNQCRTIEISGAVFSKFRAAVEKYLPIKILPAGTILTDVHVSEAVKNQKPLVSLFPNCDASKGVKNIGRHLLKKGRTEYHEYQMNSFWAKCFKFFTGQLQLTAARQVNEKQTPENIEKEKRDIPHVKLGVDNAITKGAEASSTQPVKTAVASAEPDVTEGHQDIPAILERLVQGITNISSELSAIKGLLERGSINSGH